MSSSTHQQERYASETYWEGRFASGRENSFEWYTSFDELGEIIHLSWELNAIRPESIRRGLVVGCGNSSLSLEVSRALPQCEFVHIDISESCIANMKQKHPHLDWRKMDATYLSQALGENLFDIILDKGTYDALVCDTLAGKGYRLLSQMGKCISAQGRIFLVSNRPDRMNEMNGVDGLEVLEIWRCDLSDESLLINLTYNSLNDPNHTRNSDSDFNAVIKVLPEYKAIIAKKRGRKAFRTLLRKRNKSEAAQRSMILYDKRDSHNRFDQLKPQACTRTDFCYVYVLAKSTDKQ